MTAKRQHSEEWLDGAIHQVELLCKQAAQCPDEYVVPADVTLKSSIDLMKQLRLARNPGIAITQDGEIVLTWEHAGDRFKAIVRANGNLALYQNKKTVELDVFTRRLTSVPA
jgi:hypothetical protein